MAEIKKAQTTLDTIIDDLFDGPRRITYITEGVPYLRLGDIEAGEIFLDPDQNIAPIDLDKRFYLKIQDLLITKTGDEPRAAIISMETQGALFAPDIYCVRTIPGRCSVIWLSYFLNSKYGQHLLFERSKGTTLRRLHMTDIRSIPIIQPMEELVYEIEALELEAQVLTEASHQIWRASIKGIYSEIDNRIGKGSEAKDSNIYRDDVLCSYPNLFMPLTNLASIPISSRKTIQPDQLIRYVQSSDIDPQSCLFRRIRTVLAKELPHRIRLPLHEYQVLILASGSNLGKSSHPIAIVDEKLEAGFASNAFLAIEFFETPVYFAIALKHPIVLQQIRKMVVGEIISTLRKRDIVQLNIPVLGLTWRQDFNDRAQIAWEKRNSAINLRREAMNKAEAYINQTGLGAIN